MATLDTSGFSAGKHTLEFQVSAPSSAPFVLPVEVELSAVADIHFNLFGTNLSSGTLSITRQGEISGLGFTLVDAIGGMLDSTHAQVSSSNPGIFFAKRESFGYWRFFATDNGVATLTVLAPDGTTANLNVEITLPESPKVLSAGFSQASISNKGDAQNSFNAEGTSTIGVGWEGIELTSQNTQWMSGNTQASTTFQVREGIMPGNYLFRAYTFTGSAETGITETSSRHALLEVLNDPSRGMLSGRVVDFGASPAHMMPANIHLYNASTEALVLDQFVYLMGEPKYTLPYLSPGNYKLLFLPADIRKAAQWYPNARGIQAAQPITITAGDELEGYHFFLSDITLREALDFDTPDLFTSGFQILGSDTGWYGQRQTTHDSEDALQSPMLMDEGAAFVEGTLEGPGTLRFWWKVSSETNADHLTFTLNWNTETELKISGEVEWSEVVIELPPGANTVSWQ